MSTRTGRVGVALGGFMGSGKSTVGRILADRLGLVFLDTDAHLAERFGPISLQFEAEGEAVFRARERALVQELVVGPSRVVATGGGLWVDPINREVLRRAFALVVLEAPLEELRRRVGDDPNRPLWGPRVAELLEARRPHYADADLVLHTAGRAPAGLAEEIEQWLKHEP